LNQISFSRYAWSSFSWCCLRASPISDARVWSR
jgi:hypothetical protein